ncbi:hypothetical protein ScPMuIL_008092 [Solemya velum]
MTDNQTLKGNTKISADILSEFLETAIHCILYARELYPTGVFSKRKKYNVPVQICMHPDVSLYVTNVVEGVKEFLQNQETDRVSVVILSSRDEPIEKFVFEIGEPDRNSGDDKYLYRLEQSLRGFVLKLNLCGAVLSPLPDDCTWTVQLHTQESSAQKHVHSQVEKDFPWIEADRRQTVVTDAKIVPMTAVSSETIKFEHNQAKDAGIFDQFCNGVSEEIMIMGWSTDIIAV